MITFVEILADILGPGVQLNAHIDPLRQNLTVTAVFEGRKFSRVMPPGVSTGDWGRQREWMESFSNDALEVFTRPEGATGVGP